MHVCVCDNLTRVYMMQKNYQHELLYICDSNMYKIFTSIQTWGKGVSESLLSSALQEKNANDFNTKDQIVDTSNDWFYE